MDNKEFKTIEKMRIKLDSKEKELQKEKDFLSQLRKSRLDIIKELRVALQAKEQSYLKNKETTATFDEKYNTSNKTQRDNKIKELTTKERNTFNKFERESTRAIEYYEKCILDLEQELKDFKRQYSNLKDYYRTKEQQFVVIDSKRLNQPKKLSEVQ